MRGLSWLLLLALLVSGSKAMATLAITGEVVIEPHPSVLVRGQQATITYWICPLIVEPKKR